MEKSKKWLLAAVYALAFGYGLTCTMIAPLIPYVIEDFALTSAQGGFLMTFLNIGALVSVSFSLYFADRFPNLPIYAAAYILFSAALLCIVGAPSYTILLALMLLVGIGSKVVDILANPILAAAFSEGGERYLNLLHMFLSAGGCLSPMLLQFLLNAGISWRAAFAGIGALCCALLLVCSPVLLRTAHSESARQAEHREVAPFRLTAVMVLLGFAAFFNQAHQIIVNTWGTVYAQRALGVSDGIAGLAATVLWFGIILSRLLASRLAGPKNTVTLIFWGSIGGGAALALGALSNQPAAAYIGLFLAGLLAGAVIPLCIARLCMLYPAVSGRVTSLVFLMLVTSALVFPSVSGRLADTAGFRWVMVLSGAFLLISAFISRFIPSQPQKSYRSENNSDV